MGVIPVPILDSEADDTASHLRKPAEFLQISDVLVQHVPIIMDTDVPTGHELLKFNARHADK